MKKLPICALSAGALFVVTGTVVLLFFIPRPAPFGLLFPLLWDVAMVAIGLGVVFRCSVARRAGVAWSIFCILASLAVGAATLWWMKPQESWALGRDRVTFMCLAAGFGVLFGLWQLLVLRTPEGQAWIAGDTSHPGDTHATPQV